MGWWWSSTSSPPSTEVPTTTPDLAIAKSTPKATIPLPPSKPLSRDQQADRDLESFLATLESNAPASATPPTLQHNTTITPAPKETPTQYAPSGTTDPTSQVDLDNLDISPEALYPRSMSCRQAFDQAFYCQSLGGKFNDLYRYGGIRSCSENWSQFWFCMKIRTMGDEERQRQTAEWYAARDERIKKERGGSSEDIWELRSEPVRKAFWKDPDEVTQT